MTFPGEQQRTAEYWDGLKTQEQLEKVFKAMQDSGTFWATINNFGMDPELPGYYQNEEFKEVAAKLRPMAENMLPVLKDISKHIPFNRDNEHIKNAVALKLQDFFKDIPVPLAMLYYTEFLIKALEGEYVDRIERGFTIPETRAKLRAYKRFQAIKKEEDSRRAEFEKTAEYRLQKMELKLGLRDHIDYPK
ncbi:hypothetical protein SAMN04487864_1234 [Succiniclasticum ruminis]|uniref:Uncharacterized protein n=1 Tax=Succiniclasticum ruminis TaxID=40841 RepID=A0A1G6PAH0_9FIRM|nr:hypothetical protein [Succiniclasticum ruminis]SDC76417.1 hypothetical protein SAMN04487864_1234 [Succiniclasticum ruminis]